MILDKEENAFKDLIQSTGYDSAPKGLVHHVIKQLQKDQRESLSPSSPLLPSWVWFSIVTLIVSFIVFSFNQYPHSESTLLSGLIQKLSFLTINWSWVPRLSVGAFNNIIFACLLPALLLQFYFIKSYYERTI